MSSIPRFPRATCAEHAWSSVPRLLGAHALVLVSALDARAQCPSWSDASPGLAFPEVPRDILAFDDGSGPTLWLAYTGASWDNTSFGGVKRWSGSTWVQSMPTTAFGMTSLAVFDDGSGPRLHAGGKRGVWRFDSGAWTMLGPIDLWVQELAVFDLTGVPELYAAGYDGTLANAGGCIVKYANGAWVPLGQGFVDSRVYDLEVFDDGSGPALFAAGVLENPQGVPGAIYRQTPSGWLQIQNPPSLPYQILARDLAVHDDGGGAALYSSFIVNGANGLAIGKWDGSSWSTLPGLFQFFSSTGEINAIESHVDDATGREALFVGGHIGSISGMPVENVARWDGTSWGTLAAGVSGSGNYPIYMLRSLPAAPLQARRLLVGGGFEQAGGQPAYRLATWGGCRPVGSVVCAGDGGGAACPCANFGAFGRGCANSTGRGAALYSDGVPSVSADSAILYGIDMPNGPVLFFQGTGAIHGGFGEAFGDGLRCIGGAVIRLATDSNVSGSSHYPTPGAPPISLRGLVPPSGGQRHYQLWYRNAATFCTSEAFNLTNGLSVVWQS